MKSERERPITLEDLLRLKRAERPPAEFWATFDRELRAKQLSALVAKRPWWQRLPGTVLRMPKYRVALGAVAIVCLTVFSAKNFRSTPTESADASAASRPTVAAKSAVMPAGIAPSDLTSHVAASVVTSSSLESATLLSASEPVVVAPSAPGANAPAAALVAEEAVETVSPSARHIAGNLARVQSSDQVGAKGLLAVASIEPRVLPTRVAIEPLHQMTPPDESRRARYFTAMVSTTSLDTSVGTAERAANRIAQDQLYDRVRRLDARGDRLKWKL